MFGYLPACQAPMIEDDGSSSGWGGFRDVPHSAKGAWILVHEPFVSESFPGQSLGFPLCLCRIYPLRLSSCDSPPPALLSATPCRLRSGGSPCTCTNSCSPRDAGRHRSADTDSPSAESAFAVCQFGPGCLHKKITAVSE